MARTIIFLAEPTEPWTIKPSISTLSSAPTGSRVETFSTNPGAEVGVGIGVGVEVVVGVAVGVEVAVGVGVGVEVGLGYGVGIGVEVGLAVGAGLAGSAALATPSKPDAL